MIFIPIHLLEISISRKERAFACKGATNCFFYFFVLNKLEKDMEQILEKFHRQKENVNTASLPEKSFVMVYNGLQ